MRKQGILIAATTIISALSLSLSSCKKSHEAPVKPKLSMEAATQTVVESDGDITVNFVLDRPALADFTITYVIDGSTAREKLSATQSNPNYDYEITSTYLETKILKGESSGAINIKLYSDFILENDEIIDIAITSVDSDQVEITRDDETKVTIKQEDGLLVVLQWGIGEDEDYTDVDMDLFTWAENNDGDLGLTSVYSAEAGFTGPEFVFLATALMGDGTYGLSCNYYSGTQEPMNFKVSYVKIVGDDEEDPIERTGTYTLDNINPWDQSEVDPLLVMTFEKSGTNFSDFSEIETPAEGSRTTTGKIQKINAVRSNDIDKGVLGRYFAH